MAVLTNWTIVGMLGDVLFTTSAGYVKTIQNMQWSSSAKYAEHEIHGGTTQLEFTGCAADEISLEIKLSAYWGVDPISNITQLLEYEREGRALRLILGEKAYGKDKWVITSSNRQPEAFDRAGNLLEVIYSLTLKSYEE